MNEIHTSSDVPPSVGAHSSNHKIPSKGAAVPLFTILIVVFAGALILKKAGFIDDSARTPKHSQTATLDVEEQEVYDHALNHICRNFGIPTADLPRCANDNLVNFRKIRAAQLHFTARDYCESTFGC